MDQRIVRQVAALIPATSSWLDPHAIVLDGAQVDISFIGGGGEADVSFSVGGPTTANHFRSTLDVIRVVLGEIDGVERVINVGAWIDDNRRIFDGG